MFCKEVKIRSNNQIKTSDKKNLIKDVLAQYPLVNEEELKSLIKVKESEISFSKIVTHDSTDLIVYFVDKIPYFFKTEKDNQLIPTVYFLWKFPNIFPKFYTHREVFNRLANGADLMLPGLIVNEPVSLYTFKHIKKNDLCSICLSGNDAPIAIGRSCLSGEDMYMSGMKGRFLSILNIYEDHLWALGDRSIQIPLIKPQESPTQQQEHESVTSNSSETEQDKDKAKKIEEHLETLKINADEVRPDNVASAPAPSSITLSDKEEDDEDGDESSKIDHEKLLEDCFLSAIKFRSKEFKLPIIVSTFMKTMQSCSNLKYDLKKTKYKKISVFLKEMEKKNVIKTKELQKGVLSITEINKESETVKYFKKPEWFKSKEDNDAELNSAASNKHVFEVAELFKIDGNTEEFFRPKYKKGDVVSAAEIRQFTMNYIKEKSLQQIDQPKYVKLDDLVLTKLFFKGKYLDRVTFEELFSIIFSKLSPMHQIKKVFSDSSMQNLSIKKGKFQPIEFKLESRGGNKKVTCVYHLSEFDLDSTQLQNKIKKIIGCSVTVSEPTVAGASAQSDYIICVQGNQIYPVSEILKNEFGVQLKQMVGLELGVKGP